MIAKQVVVLVGGKGTRLGELSRETPKPLMPIDGDLRFLDYLVDQISRQGFSEIVLVAGHLGEQFGTHYANHNSIYGTKIRVVREPAPLGTAGALTAARDMLDDAFLVMNGDAFLDVNMRKFERQADRLKMPAVVASLEIDDSTRYGTLEISGNRILKFKEKVASARGRARINAGLYRLTKSLLNSISVLPSSLETMLFPALADAGLLGTVPVDGWFLDIGIPEALAEARDQLPTRTLRPCIFLDRDNTLVLDKGYTHKLEDLKWVDGAKSAIKKFNDSGWRVVVCTNQAGVAHGYYSEEDVLQFHMAMNASLADDGAFIDKFYYCPYHAEGVVQRYKLSHEDRKPGPGMITRALREIGIDFEKSVLVGDAESDVAAARAAKIRGYLFPGGDLEKYLRTLVEFSDVFTD